MLQILKNKRLKNTIQMAEDRRQMLVRQTSLQKPLVLHSVVLKEEISTFNLSHNL